MASTASRPETPTQGVSTPWTFKLALLACGTLVGLLLAETVVRLAHLAPEVVLVQEGRFRLSPNPLIGYEPVPDFDFEGKTDSFHDYVGTSNSLGFRDREHTLVKEPGTSRILLLGDSVAAGQGVRLAKNAFPALVEQQLLEAGLPIELINFAVTGYNTQQEVWTLHDKGLDFDPDLVVVAYCLNDRKRSDGGILPTLMARELQTTGVTRPRSHPWLLESALFRLLRYRLLAPPGVAEEGDDVAEAIAAKIPPDGVADALGLLAELRDEHGFRVLVVILPRFGKLLNYRFAAEHQYIEDIARRHDFATFDLLPAFQTCRRALDGRLGADSFHPTPLGHRCAGDALARYLFENSRRLGLGG